MEQTFPFYLSLKMFSIQIEKYFAFINSPVRIDTPFNFHYWSGAFSKECGVCERPPCITHLDFLPRFRNLKQSNHAFVVVMPSLCWKVFILKSYTFRSSVPPWRRRSLVQVTLHIPSLPVIINPMSHLISLS